MSYLETQANRITGEKVVVGDLEVEKTVLQGLYAAT